MAAERKKVGSSLDQAPNRVWERTGKFTEDGSPMWASREWNKGEKEAYLNSIKRRPEQSDLLAGKIE